MTLTALLDAGTAIAGINLLNTFVNIYWTVRLKAIQGNKELMQDLTEQNRAKDEIIKTLKAQKEAISKKYFKLKEKNI